MTDIDPDRRKVLMASGAALTVGLAGCLGDDDDDDDNGEPETLEEHLEGANNYDGTFEDWTGEEEVEIAVTDDNGNSFDPAAVEISEGTTVTWVWEDSGHSSTYVDLADQNRGNLWDSGTEDEGHEEEYTFDEAGEYAYICVPHEGQGHLGGVRVVEE